jgi:hypothetical protein
MVGAELMLQRREASALSHASGGSDEEVGVMFGLAIPLSFHANAAATEEAEAALGAAIWAKKAAIDRLAADLRDALFLLRNARRVRELYDDHLLPQARETLTDADQWSAGDAERYADLLEARAIYYAFSLARERAVADEFQALARIEGLVGAALAPEQVAP